MAETLDRGVGIEARVLAEPVIHRLGDTAGINDSLRQIGVMGFYPQLTRLIGRKHIGFMLAEDPHLLDWISQPLSDYTIMIVGNKKQIALPDSRINLFQPKEGMYAQIRDAFDSQLIGTAVIFWSERKKIENLQQQIAQLRGYARSPVPRLTTRAPGIQFFSGYISGDVIPDYEAMRLAEEDRWKSGEKADELQLSLPSQEQKLSLFDPIRSMLE